MSEAQSMELARLARLALDARDFKQAHTLIERALGSAPPLHLAADLLVMRSMAQRAANDAQGARESLQEALQWYSALGLRPPEAADVFAPRRFDRAS